MSFRVREKVNIAYIWGRGLGEKLESESWEEGKKWLAFLPPLPAHFTWGPLPVNARVLCSLMSVLSLLLGKIGSVRNIYPSLDL